MLRKINIVALLCIAFSVKSFADTPPIMDVTKLRAGSNGTGLLNAVSGAISVFAPCPTVGHVLKSNGSAWTCAADSIGTSLPDQAGNAGKFLSTDGTSASWQTASGSGTVTNVTSTDGSIDITNPTIAPNLSVHFPMSAFPSGSAGAPAYRFDADTGMYSPSDGVLRFSTNGTQAFEITNTQEAIFPNTVTASNFIYPAKTANTFLAGPTTGSAIPSFRTIASGDIEAADLPFPMNAPGGSAANPSYNFDADSGMFSPSDGIIGFSTNGTQRLRIENDGAINMGGSFSVGGNLNVTGTIAASNYPPTGTPGYLAYYRPSDSKLAENPAWTISEGFTGWFGLYGNQTWVAPADGGGAQYPRSLSSFIQVSLPQDTTEFIPEAVQIEMQIDSANTGKNLQNAYGLLLSKSHNGDGTINYQSNLDVADYLGNGTNTGTATDVSTVNIYGTVATGYTVSNSWFLLNNNMNIAGSINGGTISNMYAGGAGSVTGNFTGGNIGVQVPVAGSLNLLTLNNNQTVGDNYNGIFISSSSAVTNNATLYGASNNGAIGGSLNMSNFFNESSGTIAGDYRAGQYGNNATVANNSAGVLNNQNGDVTKSHTGFGSYVGADVGDGTGNSLIHFDGATNNGSHTIDGNLFGLNINNDYAISGNNTIAIVNANNNTNGVGYRFGGIGIFNQANMSEEVYGFRFNNDGDTRTASGIDINLQGNATDDVRGLRVNVSQQTSSSTTNHVLSGEFQGGLFNIASNAVPFDNGAVDIGNYYGMTTEIANPSPIAGTDIIQQIMQSNLILHDTVGAGPFGLGVNGIGMVNQLAFDTGVTLPSYRAVLLGAQNPQGSGSLTNFTAVTILGLPSFGGALSVANKTALEDSNLVGQELCDGVSGDCWFIKGNDNDANNAFGKIAINTANKKVSSSDVRFEINNGHIKSTQSSATTAAPDANAGTGATCVATSDSTDTKGTIQLTTGASSWASGAQCVVTFNLAHGNAPKCVISPNNDTAAVAQSNVYKSQTTTALTLSFVNPDIAANSYEWDYICIQ